MLDIQFIRDNPEKVKKGVADKQLDPKLVDRVLELDEKRRKLIAEIEELRAKRNVITKKIKKSLTYVIKGQKEKPKEPKKSEVKMVRIYKEELREKETNLAKVEAEYKEALYQVPSLPLDDAPKGKSEKDNVEVSKWGEPKQFDFKPKDHLELGKELDILDFERGSKVAGSSFYFLKNDGVLLELALVGYGLEFLAKKGFTPFITPDLARERYYVGTGYLPRGPEAQTYEVKGQDLGLIATAEVTLAGYHADEVLAGKDLPRKYSGYSHCYRVEAGGYGKYSKGLYRVHQFTKVEMFVYCLPEESRKMHQLLLDLEEKFWQSLEMPYRVVEMCTGDLGAQASKKFDLEVWMPGRDDWGEITSTSNTTDYQARRLNIKYQKGGKTGYVYTLNGTLVATARGLIAILENYQQKDGSVAIPKVLQKWVGKEKIVAGSQ